MFKSLKNYIEHTTVCTLIRYISYFDIGFFIVFHFCAYINFHIFLAEIKIYICLRILYQCIPKYSKKLLAYFFSYIAILQKTEENE